MFILGVNFCTTAVCYARKMWYCVMYFQLFVDSSNQKVASELSVELLQTFAMTLEQLAIANDRPGLALYCTIEFIRDLLLLLSV